MIPPRDMDRILSFGSKQAKKRVQRRARRGDQGQDRLPPEASITLAAEREATGIDSILAALEDDLIGLAPIKQKVNEIASLLLVDRARPYSAGSCPGRWKTPGSPTPAASATTWTGPGCGTRSGWRPSRTGCGTGTT